MSNIPFGIWILKGLFGEGGVEHYVNAKTKVTIICPEHGIFKQLPLNHNRGRGCANCKRKNNPSIT